MLGELTLAEQAPADLCGVQEELRAGPRGGGRILILSTNTTEEHLFQTFIMSWSGDSREKISLRTPKPITNWMLFFFFFIIIKLDFLKKRDVLKWGTE